jgi:hypothetical protein
VALLPSISPNTNVSVLGFTVVSVSQIISSSQVLSDIFSSGQELSAKPFSLLSTNPRFLRTVVLKEDLPAMKDTAGRAGGLLMGRIILTGISQGKHKFRLEYPIVDGKTICMAICACGYEVEILYFENYGGTKDLQMKWQKHIGTWKGWI